MNTFNATSVDHLIGMRVEDISYGLEPGEWTLKFEGGVMLNNKSPVNVHSPSVQNRILQSVTYDSDQTILFFDNGEQVSLLAVDYSITGTDGLERYPQRSTSPAEVLEAKAKKTGPPLGDLGDPSPSS